MELVQKYNSLAETVERERQRQMVQQGEAESLKQQKAALEK